MAADGTRKVPDELCVALSVMRCGERPDKAGRESDTYQRYPPSSTTGQKLFPKEMDHSGSAVMLGYKRMADHNVTLEKLYSRSPEYTEG